MIHSNDFPSMTFSTSLRINRSKLNIDLLTQLFAKRMLESDQRLIAHFSEATGQKVEMLVE